MLDYEKREWRSDFIGMKNEIGKHTNVLYILETNFNSIMLGLS